jgi:hypothetical protein
MYLLCNFVINSIVGGVLLSLHVGPFDMKYFNAFYWFLEFGLK